MKNLVSYAVFTLIISSAIIKPAKAQDPQADPGAYMSAISKNMFRLLAMATGAGPMRIMNNKI